MVLQHKWFMTDGVNKTGREENQFIKWWHTTKDQNTENKTNYQFLFFYLNNVILERE